MNKSTAHWFDLSLNNRKFIFNQTELAEHTIAPFIKHKLKLKLISELFLLLYVYRVSVFSLAP